MTDLVGSIAVVLRRFLTVSPRYHVGRRGRTLAAAAATRGLAAARVASGERARRVFLSRTVVISPTQGDLTAGSYVSIVRCHVDLKLGPTGQNIAKPSERCYVSHTCPNVGSFQTKEAK